MSPEDVKQWVDILSTLLAAGGGGGILLAVIGYMRAKVEKPHIAPPTVGGNGLAQIAGMVMGQTDLKDIIDGLRGVSASHDRCTLMRETEMAFRKKEAEEHREHERRLLEERRQHEQRLAEDRHREHREMVEAIQGLTRSTKDMRCAG
ncbi:hypothetical protein [Methylobacterium sp. E-045]|uniref:hypothetical protein n=1 Tax=Methylobacterium sp. E-045 TaxID=2836575 RepID=UPI001FBB911B|nr:hypothetical protein [Methylobacterium sp. E-045]MCJ2132435.1 hypothetical protein [Methylobacterium sp. E-045]